MKNRYVIVNLADHVPEAYPEQSMELAISSAKHIYESRNKRGPVYVFDLKEYKHRDSLVWMS